MITLNTYLVISGIVFVLGLVTIINKKNAIGILMGVELILNSVNLNFVAFGRYIDFDIKGQIIAIFVIILAAAEAAVALAIVLNIYRNKQLIDVTKIDAMKN